MYIVSQHHSETQVAYFDYCGAGLNKRMTTLLKKLHLFFCASFLDNWKFTTNYFHVSGLYNNSLFKDLFLILGYFAWFLILNFSKPEDQDIS